MFNFFKKEKPKKPIEIRDMLFGDLPISEWPRDQTLDMEPWISFIEARKYLDKRNKPFAFKALQKITEMPGADIVAAYTDYTARYLHHTGAGVIWERPDSSLDAEIDALLKAGQAVANVIGPSDQARPPRRKVTMPA